MSDALAGIATQVLPLFGIAALAWMIGDKVPGASRLISTILVYALIPLLIVDKVLAAEITELIVIPPLMFVVAALMALPARRLAKRLGDDFDPKLLSAGFSFFNVAFFGLPVGRALFGEAAISTMVCAYIGSALYGDTIGYYLVARTKEGKRRAASQALRIPLFYAFILAVILKIAGVETPAAVEPVASVLSIAVSVLGMAVIGFNLTPVARDDLKPRLLATILATRQVAAIVLVAAALGLEAATIDRLGTQDRILIGLIGLFPIAANVSLFASLLGTRQKEAATLVAVSSVLSLALVTLAVAALGMTSLV